MRYLGNKTKLLPFIEKTIQKYHLRGDTFADLFAGTGTVGDYFKDRYKIISNDFLYYSFVLNKAKLLNPQIPNFVRFEEEYGENIFRWLNTRVYIPDNSYFIYNNYTPVGDRMFFTEKNAIKIDGMRMDIDTLKNKHLISESEYFFLLASLLESVTRVSNTSGTYEAYFKFWESRAKKDFILEPLEMKTTDSLYSINNIYQEDTNKLIRKISGDIAYIDTPYTVTQYVSAYHMLETIAKYDSPRIKGVGGKRERGNKNSLYARKNSVREQFEDLFRQLQFRYVMVSYSNQGLLDLDELVELAKLFAVNGEVHIEKQAYSEYQNHRSSNKRNGKQLNEVLIIFEKDNSINKSPLNYSGSKDKLVPIINKELPKHVGTFVDAMGGAFNVGANVTATDKIVYNDVNTYVFKLILWIMNTPKNEQVEESRKIIEQFNLTKGNKATYLALREAFNQDKDIKKLFVLHLYSFQNIIRFNSKLEFNTPVGVAGYSNDLTERQLNFKPKTKIVDFINENCLDINIRKFDKDTVFYFDPPYNITKAAYNDGKRGFGGWNDKNEFELLNYLDLIDKYGRKFMLSNVIRHKEKVNKILSNWLDKRNYKIVDAGVSGWRYSKDEVIIKNF